jgi:putative OmpL-like beta-barrel porin-2
MKLSGLGKNGFWIFTVVLLFAGLGSGVALANDDAKDASPSTSAHAKRDSTTPLTERERELLEQQNLLLEQMRRLEKRVADLEARETAAGDRGTDTTAVGASSSMMPRPKAGAPSVSAVTMSAAGAGQPTEVSPAPALPSAKIATPESSSAAPIAAPIGPPQEQTASAQQLKYVEPFSDADWTWLNGNARTKDIYWGNKFFTPEIRADVNYVVNFNHPTDHSMGGSSELFRSYEVQLEQFGVGGDFHYDNVRARVMTQFGMYSATTPRNDPSPGHGQWDLNTAYRYVSEAYGGYHFDVLHGINVDAGIFMSYIGLFSYYNFDNWAYQPSYVSSNTPWFFNGVRVQIFPSEHLKIEPWFINGWQSYASANHTPGVGGQIKWTPKPWLNIISNNYAVGQDDLFIKGRRRIHTDDSIEVKYYDKPEKTLDKMAFSLTADLGCEYGAGVSCYTNKSGGPKQSFIGWMGYNRFWFHRDLFGVTVGYGQINNPGRYLVLIPPINGATAITAATNAPYFTGNPGDPFKAWDSSFTFDYMPKQYITFRWEYDYRHASVPYWSGRGGITPPGGNNGSPQFFSCSSGASSGQTTLAAAETSCGGGIGSVWFPDLRKNESFIDMAIMVKF